MTKTIEEIDNYVGELKDHIKQLKGKKANSSYKDSEVILQEKANGKNAVLEKTFPKDIKKSEALIQKFTERKKKEETEMSKKESLKQVALGTSKTNYNDPRISVAWCKSFEVPVEKVFPKTLYEKFVWSMDIQSTWKF